MGNTKFFISLFMKHVNVHLNIRTWASWLLSVDWINSKLSATIAKQSNTPEWNSAKLQNTKKRKTIKQRQNERWKVAKHKEAKNSQTAVTKTRQSKAETANQPTTPSFMHRVLSIQSHVVHGYVGERLFLLSSFFFLIYFSIIYYFSIFFFLLSFYLCKATNRPLSLFNFLALMLTRWTQSNSQITQASYWINLDCLNYFSSLQIFNFPCCAYLSLLLISNVYISTMYLWSFYGFSFSPTLMTSSDQLSRLSFSQRSSLWCTTLVADPGGIAGEWVDDWLHALTQWYAIPWLPSSLFHLFQAIWDQQIRSKPSKLLYNVSRNRTLKLFMVHSRQMAQDSLSCILM